MQNQTHTVQGARLAVIAVLSAFLVARGTGLAQGAAQKTFATPNAAMTALITAVRSRATDQVTAILGPELSTFRSTRDKAQDEVDRQIFLDASKVLKLEKQSDPNKVIAYMGVSEWPFPAPLVKTGTAWKFDGQAAVEEILDRQIGRNELAAIDVSRAYLGVQLEYFSTDHHGDGYLQFAQKINSTAGKADGLYWSNANGEDVSPIGPFAAQAAGAEPNLPGELAPLWGYYFKILTAQGAAARGGARNYVVDGRMLTGFALVAWPAEYGVAGVSTFVVNQVGTVYQKDLGTTTAQLAPAMNEFNPDSTWLKVE